MDYYIHQIGSFKEKSTYVRLIKILQDKMICSRDFLEKQGIVLDNDNESFKLEIPEEKKWMYYDDDIHKDRVSLSDPHNHFIKKAIEKKDHQNFTCFDYDYIAFAVSRDVPIVSSNETFGLALGEVQVKDKIDSKYIVGLVLPFDEIQMKNETNFQIVQAVFDICEKNDFPLNIYNYEGQLIFKKTYNNRNKR